MNPRIADWPLPQRLPAAEPLAVAFSSRNNSFGFLRWLFAVLVIFDHTYPLGGFANGLDPVRRWSMGQESLGGISVAGFFVISGFLITRSRLKSGTARFLWHRFLRIFPGFWVCLLVTAFVLAPLAWHHERGGVLGVLAAGRGGPTDYVRHNLWLNMHQYGIANLLTATPFGKVSGGAWDGSLWTLIYEFHCYLLIALLGLTGVLSGHRWLVLVLTAALYTATVSYSIDPIWQGKVLPILADYNVARFTFLFMLGSVFALYAERILYDDRLAILAALVAAWSLHKGGWLLLGYPAFGYVVLALAIRLPLQRVGRRADLSYGIYIYAFPIQMLLAEHSLQRQGGPLLFSLVSLLLASIAAFISWHLVEKMALRLKDWSPRLPRRQAPTRPLAAAPADEPLLSS
jgi:peptidoglycan/LPS O-acetylase OafA/YrhL